MIFGCLKCNTVFEEDQEAVCPECFSGHTMLVSEILRKNNIDKEYEYEELDFDEYKEDN